jgi:hypothetical protein
MGGGLVSARDWVGPYYEQQVLAAVLVVLVSAPMGFTVGVAFDGLVGLPLRCAGAAAGNCAADVAMSGAVTVATAVVAVLLVTVVGMRLMFVVWCGVGVGVLP